MTAYTFNPQIRLPDLLCFDNGQPVRNPADWERRRREIYAAIVPLEYGGLPPTPALTRSEELHRANVRWLPGARYISCRVHIEGGARPFSFMLYLTVPAGDGPFPVVLTGDACWRYVSDEITSEVIGRGYVLAQFNRVELAPDSYNSERTSGIYTVYPDGEYGALAAWAWGYHRCIDVLQDMKLVDAACIAVVGHSRGGKTSLLAGATDKRIGLTSANDSGAGGAGCYRYQGPESETLADSLRLVPYWYGPRLKQYIDCETDLPFDQHSLKALVAPRPLLTTEALGDLWANPTGTWRTYKAAAEVYRFLGVEDRIGIWYRPGEHEHGRDDWHAFLDFADWHFKGILPDRCYDDNPFPSRQEYP